MGSWTPSLSFKNHPHLFRTVVGRPSLALWPAIFPGRRRTILFLCIHEGSPLNVRWYFLTKAKWLGVLRRSPSQLTKQHWLSINDYDFNRTIIKKVQPRRHRITLYTLGVRYRLLVEPVSTIESMPLYVWRRFITHVCLIVGGHKGRGVFSIAVPLPWTNSPICNS